MASFAPKEFAERPALESHRPSMSFSPMLT
jgi:hypothetical protein